MGWPKGKPMSIETRLKLSQLLSGRKQSPEHIEKGRLAKLGTLNPAWGKTTSDKQKQAVRLRMSGKNHPFWAGGSERLLERRRLNENRRRARMNESGGNFTLTEWNKMKTAFAFTCPRCFRSEPEIKLTIDHIMPISFGGKNTRQNIQPLCKACNSSKKNHHATRYFSAVIHQQIASVTMKPLEGRIDRRKK